MNREEISESRSYDTEAITAAAKRRSIKLIITSVLLFSVLMASVIISQYFPKNIPIFLLCTLVALISVFTLKNKLKEIKFSDYKSSRGEIVNVHKESKTVDTMSVGGINPFGTRKYDSYKNNELRISVYIKDEKGIHDYHLKGVSEEHARYYEDRGEAIHIKGTRYPVKLSVGDGKWLCPICGNFNENSEKLCTGCGVKAIK